VAITSAPVYKRNGPQRLEKRLSLCLSLLLLPPYPHIYKKHIFDFFLIIVYCLVVGWCHFQSCKLTWLITNIPNVAAALGKKIPHKPPTRTKIPLGEETKH